MESLTRPLLAAMAASSNIMSRIFRISWIFFRKLLYVLFSPDCCSRPKFEVLPKNCTGLTGYISGKESKMAKRKNYSPDFKAKVVLAALSNEKTVAELSMEYGIHQNLINKWKAQLNESASGIFAGAIKNGRSQKGTWITWPSCENRSINRGTRFISASLGEAVSISRRRSMVLTDHEKLSITRQCELLHICRSGFYYKKPENRPIIWHWCVKSTRHI